MKLYDVAKVVRSKNAGPFTLTLDLIVESEEDFDRVLNAPDFSANRIAELYATSPGSVRICPFKRILAIKVSLPRQVSSGAPGDVDVYGSQQHFPLGNISIP